jgi:hypothetical protein
MDSRETVTYEIAREFPNPPTDPRYEVGDIFREYGPAYRQTHHFSGTQHKVMRAIENCRTEA